MKVFIECICTHHWSLFNQNGHHKYLEADIGLAVHTVKHSDGNLSSTARAVETMAYALAKIHPHTSPSLVHQKALATLFHVIKATFHEQNTEPSATAYFSALLTTLDGSRASFQSSRASGSALSNSDVLPAMLYLLAAVATYVSRPVICSHLSTIITLTSPLFPALSTQAPSLRSQLVLYGNVLLAFNC